MKQTRLTSLFKSLVSTAVGFGVAFVANMLILPLFGLDISHSANLLLTTIYTVISIARGYALERAFEALGWRQRISPFMSAVMAERERQITHEGWSHEHDDKHEPGELARAGAAYAYSARDWIQSDGSGHFSLDQLWPWSMYWWKPTGFRRDLVKGCALIVAEGEKFDRSRKSKPRPMLVQGGYTVPAGNGIRPAPPTTGSGVTLAHGKTRSQHSGSSG